MLKLIQFYHIFKKLNHKVHEDSFIFKISIHGETGVQILVFKFSLPGLTRSFISLAHIHSLNTTPFFLTSQLEILKR